VMHLVDALLETVNLFAEGLEQRVERSLAGMGEGLALFFEDLVGQVLEFGLELLAGLLERLLEFFIAGQLLGMGGLQAGELFLGVGKPLSGGMQGLFLGGQ